MTASRRGPSQAAGPTERELLARLGLGRGASDQEVETARDAIVAFLATAPRDLKAWAQGEVGAIDEAYALLSDPEAVTVADAAGVPSEPPVLVETGLPTRHVAPIRRRRLGPVARVLVAGAALALVVGVGYGVYAAGSKAVPGFTGTPAPEASASPAIDQAKVADLMQKITTNPKDTASLVELGNIYFDARDYKTSADFMSKVVALDPKNVDALVALGAATFNQGDSSGAEAEWRKAIAVDPKKQEAYYDLGFMYLSANPPDMANVTAMWTKVLEIDPTTAIAQTVKTHLDSFASASPGATGSFPTSSPSASSGATSPATSPATSATAAPTAAQSASPSAGN